MYMSCLIYKITTGNDIYVGSTFDFKGRMRRHRYSINNENSKDYNFKIYKKIRENNGEWEMTIYEDNLSMSKDELRKYEEEIRLLLGATLNSQRAYRTKEQLKEDASKSCKLYNDEHKEYFKELRAANKENIKCECGSIVTRYEISRHRRTKKHITLMTSSA